MPVCGAAVPCQHRARSRPETTRRPPLDSHDRLQNQQITGHHPPRHKNSDSPRFFFFLLDPIRRSIRLSRSKKHRFLIKSMARLDLERRYAFYAAYHSNPANVLVHVVCVWPILLTAMLPLRYAPPLPLLRFYCPLCRQYLPVQLGFPVAVALGVFYALMDRRAGTAAAVLCVAGWGAGNLLADAAGLWTFRDAWRPLLTAQVVLWSAQFFAHAFFEKRRPALVDSPVQAVVTAPLFVFIEVLHRLFGYEPTPGFYKRVQARVAAMHNGPPVPEKKEEEEEKERVSKAAEEESSEKDS